MHAGGIIREGTTKLGTRERPEKRVRREGSANWSKSTKNADVRFSFSVLQSWKHLGLVSGLGP